MDLAWIALATGAFAMLIVAYLTWSIYREPPGTPQMRDVARYIRNGAKTFLKRQYKTILFLIILLSFPMGAVFRSIEIVFSFILGALLSLIAAYIGMNIAVRANVRTANAAATSPARAFTLAFRGGAVMGLSVVGLSLVGISMLYLLFSYLHGHADPNLMVGYGFGASLAALFAQLGGGIFTKAADIGADLVGKIELRIPEDDPRNPAVIADQVGDNVGDCAGRGSDLFESISDDYVTAMLIGVVLVSTLGATEENVLMFPLALGMSGVIATVVGVFIVRGWKKVRPITSFNIGLFAAAAIATVGAYFSSMWLLNDIKIFFSALSGIVASTAVGLVVQYYIGTGGRPVRHMEEASKRGAAINVITGMSYALQSPFLPFIFMVGAILFSYIITGNIYGVVAANIGTDLAIGMIMSADAFGPISDNAQGIVQMVGMSAKANGTLQNLDSMGNTTKAYAKAFATASGTVSTVVLLATYIVILEKWSKQMGLGQVYFASQAVIIGILMGAAIPFVFSSFTVGATGKTAFEMVDEVRRQFKENPGILEHKTEPDYDRCIDISTKNALKKMILPTFITLASPILVGLILGPYALGGMLLGGTCTAALLASFFTFGGAVWDNTKKRIEAKGFWIKGTQMHTAAVVGDTVGDPLKDVAGPSLNIFMKLTNMTALLIAPIILYIPPLVHLP